MLKTQVKMLMEENPFTEKWYWREASLFNTLKCFIEVWSEKYEECKNEFTVTYPLFKSELCWDCYGEFKC